MTLTRSGNCVITSQATRDAHPDADLAVGEINNPANTPFKIIDKKLYVSVLNLSTENDDELLEQLKTEFKKINKWNRFRSEMSKRVKSNNLSYLIDPTFTNVNRLLVLSF